MHLFFGGFLDEILKAGVISCMNIECTQAPAYEDISPEMRDMAHDVLAQVVCPFQSPY